MIFYNSTLRPADLSAKLRQFWAISADKIRLIEQQYNPANGSPVFTVQGRYTTRGWTEWTQGFQYGSAILQFDATGETEFLTIGRQKTLDLMAPHLSHTGVHDHGFNNVSTYGNLLRLMREGRILQNDWEQNFYQLALKLSGAVQANRWTTIRPKAGGLGAINNGFIHSFNGPHSLFVDTIRSCRSLVISHLLGHVFQSEGDARINMLERAMLHITATADFSVYYGEHYSNARDSYDVWGRTAHESVFNAKDGNYRCPNSQQGYTGFSTWTRGLAWAMCGFAEQLEALRAIPDNDVIRLGGRAALEAMMLKAARATCDFYIENTPTDGIPYWDTGAPHLNKLGHYLHQPADPFNDHEPVDSSAAAIAAQGLLRLGRYLQTAGGEQAQASQRYWQAGLTVLGSLLQEPYLSTDPAHQGLLLHSIYHRPNGWDYVPTGSKIPYGESSMWGDYHLREVALYVQRIIDDAPYYSFLGCVKP